MPTGTPLQPSSDEFGIPRVDWDELGPAFIEQWGRPNGRFDPEGLTVYGKSGSGKSHFVLWALQTRADARGAHVVAVLTKPADKTFNKLLDPHDWPRIDSWPPGYNETTVVYHAKAKGITAAARVPQRAKVAELMTKLWQPNSNIIVYWDELTYVETSLRLKTEVETFYREGRTLGITNVASMQRPAYVSRLAHSEAGWTVAFPPKDQDDRKRIAEVLGDRNLYMQVLPRLDRTKHEFLIKHDLTGEAYISHLPGPRRAAGSSGVSSAGPRRVPSRQR